MKARTGPGPVTARTITRKGLTGIGEGSRTMLQHITAATR